jgi:hypothetical protein
LYFYFHDGAGGIVAWSAARKQSMLNGLLSLESYELPDGSDAVNVIDQTAVPAANRDPNAIRIRQIPASAGTPDAATNCSSSPHEIVIELTENSLAFIGQHEGGHAIDLDHTSTIDDLTSAAGVADLGTRPVMAGCARGPSPGSDDYSAMTYRRIQDSVADGGFENTAVIRADSWYQTGSPTSTSGVRFDGSYSLEMNNGDAIHQRVRIVNPQQTLNMSTRYKTLGTATRTFKGRRRTVGYPNGLACNTSDTTFANSTKNYQPASPTFGTWFTFVNSAMPSASTWTLIHGANTPTASDAFDVEAIFAISGSGSMVDNVSF